MDYKCIELAKKEDTEELLELYHSFLHGPAAWTEEYPSEETIEFDLERDALYVMRDENDKIMACISIDDDENVENLVYWDKALQPSREVSRLGVRADLHGMGLAKTMMKFAFEVLKKNGNKSIHIIVKKGHDAALKAYSDVGFKYVGECELYEKQFFCMERPL